MDNIPDLIRWQDAGVISPVVTAEMLADFPHAVLADVRWYLDGRDGRAAYEEAHIPGAIWVDLERQLSRHDLPVHEGRHPLPTSGAFARAMSELGIDDDTVVIAYDDSGGTTAGRLVLMLRMLDRAAALLDGGLSAWIADGRTVESGPGPTPNPNARFTERNWPADRLASADDVAAHAGSGGVVLDSRSYERYTGEQVLIDPRAGHVPGARSAPTTALRNADWRLLDQADLRKYFRDLGVDHDPSPIAYCGSGVNACLNVLALEHAGLKPARLYVGSWSGWSADPQRPAELGDPSV